MKKVYTAAAYLGVILMLGISGIGWVGIMFIGAMGLILDALDFAASDTPDEY